MDKPRLEEWTNSGLHEALVPRVIGLARDTAVLDIGCGTGAWLERLADLGFTNLQGCDRDPRHFGSSRARVTTFDVDQDDWPAGGGEYGLVTALEVIEHLENPGRLWRLLAKVLAREGWCLVSTPNIHCLNARLRYLLTGRLPAFDDKGEITHVQPMYLESATRVMARHGLCLEATWPHPARGSNNFRPAVVIASAACGLLLPDEIPGDTLCLKVRRCSR